MYIRSVIVFTTLALLSLLVLISMNPSGWAVNIDTSIFPLDSKPYGLTYEDWGYKWWQWFVSFTADKSPLNDQTGEKCTNGQNNTDVWFLTGTGSGAVKRSCSIPEGKAILVSVAGNSCSYLEYPNLHSESELRDCAVAGNQISFLDANLDGAALKDIRKYHITSHLFSETFPVNNVWGSAAGTTSAVYDSYLLFLQPLDAGNHTLSFRQTTLDNPTTGFKGYAYDVTYLLHIVNASGT